MSFFYDKTNNEVHGGRIAGAIAFLVVAIIFGLMAGLPAYGRYQRVADAKNQIQVNEFVAKSTEQSIQTEKQKAEIRVQEAYGIAKSQEIINSSLTGNYLQYLAIQAQEKMASSPNHTEIYVPSGQNGIPLVFGANGNGGGK